MLEMREVQCCQVTPTGRVGVEVLYGYDWSKRAVVFMLGQTGEDLGQVRFEVFELFQDVDLGQGITLYWEDLACEILQPVWTRLPDLLPG